jgi:hypothetical protein
VDVVVPAQDEEALIGPCLRAVLAGSTAMDLRIIVVANGCVDATAARAMAVPTAGQEVVVVETATAGKAGALNAADPHRRGCAVVYLDADTVLTPGSMGVLATALDDPAPLLLGPRLLMVRPTGWPARSYAAVWSRLPAVDGHVVGGGCFAVTAAGRRRWTTFPEVVADDSFVRSLFAPHERRVLDAAAFLFVLAEGRELASVVRRWRDGNAQLTAPPSAGAAANLRAVAARPGLWPHLPGYLAVLAAGRVRRPARWARAARVREVGPQAPAEPVVLAVDPELDLTPAPWGADYVLLFDPGVRPAPPAVDHLMTLASRFPDAGVYGASGGATSGATPMVRRSTAPVAMALLRSDLWHRAGRPRTVAELPRRLAARGVTTPLAGYTRAVDPAGVDPADLAADPTAAGGGAVT